MGKKSPTMLVIGLDGASWNLIDDWIDSGILPTFKDLKDRSCWGPLESSVPPVTYPAWRCYSTGKNPGKLGVFWWQRLELESLKVYSPNSRSFKSRDVWDYLNDSDIRTGIIGMPGTFPPAPVKGFMIAGGPEVQSKNYTYPPSLEDELKSEGYSVHPSIYEALEEGSPLIDEILKVIRMRFQIAKKLLLRKPVSFLQVTTFYLNMLQHYFYKGEPVKQAWQIIDEELVGMVDKFDYIVVLSDHGTAPMNKTFFINSWLEKKGYLHIKKRQGVANMLFKLGVNKTLLINVLSRLRIAGFVSKMEWAKQLARKYIHDEEGLLSDRSGKSAVDGIDWEKTKVVGLPQGSLYINQSALDNNEYEKLRIQIVNELETLIDDETGERPIEKVYLREDIYKGEYLEKAPDLVALDSDAYHNRGGVGKEYLFQPSNWKGNNARYGLFILGGPNIKNGVRIDGVSIYDLCPTILVLMGCDIPDDLDGKVIKAAYKNA